MSLYNLGDRVIVRDDKNNYITFGYITKAQPDFGMYEVTNSGESILFKEEWLTPLPEEPIDHTFDAQHETILLDSRVQELEKDVAKLTDTYRVEHKVEIGEYVGGENHGCKSVSFMEREFYGGKWHKWHQIRYIPDDVILEIND